MKERTQQIMSNKELALFCDQFAMILDAGLTHADGVSIMMEDAASSEGRKILETINEQLHEGKRLHEAAASTGVFPKYALDMMEIGEQSGKLDEVMHSLAFYYNREENIAQGIKNAVTYPFIIIFMMFIVILVLVIKVLPIFNEVFIQLGSEMTGFSKGLLNFGNTLSTYSLVFIIIFVLLAAMYFVFTKTTWGKIKFRRILSSFILTKSFYEKIAAGRFASGMALTMNAGLRPDESLAMVEKLVDNALVEGKIKNCREEIRQGASFSEALVHSGIFSNLYSRMIAVGGKSGSVDKALEKVASSYEEEVDDKINTMISVLEPTLVIIFSIIVCLILLSVMMPLMNIMTSIG